MSNTSLKRKLDSSNEMNSVPNRFQVLNDKLSRRPDRHLLVEQGILHDSNCAPSLQIAEHALKRARLVDELNSRLTNRPGPLDLIQHKILHIDTEEHPNLEEAIQGGQIPFKPTTTSSSSSYNRPLIFHEYTGSPTSCKPKVTKVDSLSSTSNIHQIRLAQQQLLLELTSDKQNTEQLLPKKSLEQMTLVELKELCKQYQIPSSHINKTKLIEKIRQTENQLHNQNSTKSEENFNEILETDIIAPLQISNINEEEGEPLSTFEFDEILRTFSVNLINQEEDQSSNVTLNFNFENPSINSEQTNTDDLFLEMLLNNDYSTTTETTFDDLIFSDLFPVPTSSSSSSLSLPRITTVDEFDAFLRDFTDNFSSHQQEVLTPIG